MNKRGLIFGGAFFIADLVGTILLFVSGSGRVNWLADYSLALSHMWEFIHSPVVALLGTWLIENTPSHGGGWKSLIVLISFYLIGLLYTFIIGYLVGKIIDVVLKRV